MYVDDVEASLPKNCHVQAWRPKVDGIAEVFHAQISDYSYPAHCHDTWTVLIVDHGAIRYDLDSRQCGALGDAVAILPPGVIHNGRRAPGAPGFKKRVLYLDESFLDLDMIGAAVDKTNIFDAELRETLVGLHDSLMTGEEELDSEWRLALIQDRLGTHLRSVDHQERPPEPVIALRLRELLDENIVQSLSLAEAARVLDRSKAHLIRSFSAAFGVSPHAYVIARRVEAARSLLLEGSPIAEVAASVGFFDQAHFTRHFKRHTSVTPGKYASCHA